VTNGTPTDNELQSYKGYSNCASAPSSNTLKGTAASETAAFTTYLFSPSQVDGSAQHLSSVQFCYGAGTGTAGSGTEKQTTSMTITQALVYEFDEHTAASSGTGGPPYANATLLNASPNLKNGSNCATVKPSSPAAIDPSGYLMFRLIVKLSASAGYADPAQNYAQPYVASAPLELGRLTVTYSP
jgi:hypothetical protein